jgi:hypothetical protein
VFRCSGGRVRVVFACAAVYGASSPVAVPAPSGGAGVTVHEWGTFTTVAGKNGHAIDWLPLSGPVDLPCFVHHYQNNPLIKLARGTQPLDYDAARSNLWGRVRMETPVLYFYAPQETSIGVRVQFPRGLMTEWYPRATVTQSVVSGRTLRDPAHASAIEWPEVRITPAAREAFPVDIAESHYYAARSTEASPLVVNGETEKFLFYRGVADFEVPLTAELLRNSRIRIRNTGPEALPAVIVFENRDGALGYRMLGPLRTEVTVAAPSLNASFAGLRAAIEQRLVEAGLYPREAAAMLDTWRDSWFEEGTRVFYILPSRTIESILPLTISPAPAHIERVFVGRMDVVTPAARHAVQVAIADNDRSVIDRYGRLLGPITDQVLATSDGSTQQVRIRELRNDAFARYTSRSATCK